MKSNLTLEQIICFLESIDGNFSPALSQRLDLAKYSQKLHDKAKVLSIVKEGVVESAIFYYEDVANQVIYIPIIGTISSSQGKGFFKRLINSLFNLLQGSAFKKVELETWLGSKAMSYYSKIGFKVKEVVKDRSDSHSVKLFKRINDKITSFKFDETPFYQDMNLSSSMRNNIFVKRDDLFPIMGGGSKARKLQYILAEALKDGVNAIVTCGGGESSHLRSSAILCSYYGIKCYSIIHDKEIKEKSINIKLIEMYSEKVVYCEKDDLKQKMDDVYAGLVLNGDKPYYLYGGGHNVEGTYSYLKAVKNLYNSHELKNIDYVFFASGTGTTQAGLALGFRKFFPEAKVVGISIARDEDRGINAIKDAILEYRDLVDNSITDDFDLIFDDKYLDGGYGNVSDTSVSILSEFARISGIPLDSTYSGKALLGMASYLKGIENKNVLFWSTGSLINFLDKV